MRSLAHHLLCIYLIVQFQYTCVGVSELLTRASVLAWRVRWTEEPGGLQSLGSQRVGPDSVTTHSSTGRRTWLTLLGSDVQSAKANRVRAHRKLAACISPLRERAEERTGISRVYTEPTFAPQVRWPEKLFYQLLRIDQETTFCLYCVLL